MPVKDRQKELSKVNQHPLNQEALRWLRLTDQEPSPMGMYLLQLILWGLDEGKIKFQHQAHGAAFREQVEAFLYRAEPADALAYLLGPRKEEPLIDVYQLQMGRVPEDAAGWLIDALNSALESDPNLEGIYPPPRLM